MAVVISVILILPNISKRTLDIYFLPNLSAKEAEQESKKLHHYLQKNYSKQYVWKTKQSIKKQILSEDIKEKIKQEGLSNSGFTVQKEPYIELHGYFIQNAFLNELAQIAILDTARTKLQSMWVEDTLKANPFKLGLDLQGGMNLILEADFVKLKAKLESNYDQSYFKDLEEKIKKEKKKDEKETLENELKTSKELLELNDSQKKEYVESALEIIRSRIDKTGVSEPLIRLQGNDKIEISLPGVASPEQAKKIIKSTANVSYHLAEPTGSEFTNQANSFFAQYKSLTNDKQRESFIDEIESNINLPKKYKIFTYWAKDKTGASNELSPQNFLVLEKKASLSGNHISPKTFVGYDPEQFQTYISFELTSDGTQLFADLTRNNQGRQMAIVIDDKIRSAPTINQPILGGRAQISGDFTDQEAKDLALIIKEGALPVPMNITQEKVVGPTLGQESIKKGLFSIFLGLLLVAIFIIIYYHASGLIAILSISLNLLFIAAFLALMNFTITLPSLAGIVLTIGMAVDANVILYERLKEEFSKNKMLKIAVADSFERASLTIFDSNLTTLLAAIVLSQFASGPIKGFAVTLLIGIICTLFTSLFVTKTIISSLVYSFNLKKLSIGFYRVKNEI